MFIPNLDFHQDNTSCCHKLKIIGFPLKCDALLFPPPRLKVGHVPTLGGGSGRIVSPPDSPIGSDLAGLGGTREPGVAFRVLAHSRSLADLNRRVDLSSPPHASTSVAHGQDPQASQTIPQSRPPWATSFAQDDLALPTPVPSLARYVFLNCLLLFHTFLIHQPQTSMEYLAAQACLGHQNLTPTPTMAELHKIFPDTYANSSSRKGSHSHNTSLGKSSNNSHSRNHSRGDLESQVTFGRNQNTVLTFVIFFFFDQYQSIKNIISFFFLFFLRILLYVNVQK